MFEGKFTEINQSWAALRIKEKWTMSQNEQQKKQQQHWISVTDINITKISTVGLSIFFSHMSHQLINNRYGDTCALS